MEKKRIAYFDAIKCLAILDVIDCHIRDNIGIVSYETISGMMTRSFVMPVFFFVSGFLAYKLHMTSGEVWSNLCRKFIFLIIPAFVFRIVMNLVKHDDLFNFITEGMHGYWFTVVLFEMFFIYYMVVLVIKNEKLRIGILLLLSLAGVGVLGLNRDVGPAICDIERFSKYFQFFVLGTLAMKYRSKYESLMTNEIVKAVLIVSFFVLLFLLTYDMPRVLYHFLRIVILRYLGTFAVISFFVCYAESFQRETKMNSLINYIGQNSLAIYLLHFFFLPHFEPRPEWFANLNMVTVHLLSMLYTVVVAGLCIVFIKFLSNSKYVRKYALGKK